MASSDRRNCAKRGCDRWFIPRSSTHKYCLLHRSKRQPRRDHSLRYGPAHRRVRSLSDSGRPSASTPSNVASSSTSTRTYTPSSSRSCATFDTSTLPSSCLAVDTRDDLATFATWYQAPRSSLLALRDLAPNDPDVVVTCAATEGSAGVRARGSSIPCGVAARSAVARLVGRATVMLTLPGADLVVATSFECRLEPGGPIHVCRKFRLWPSRACPCVPPMLGLAGTS